MKELRNAVGVTEIMQPSHALSSIKRIVFNCHNKDHTSKACRKKAKPNKVKVNNVVQKKENSTEVDNDEF